MVRLDSHPEAEVGSPPSVFTLTPCPSSGEVAECDFSRELRELSLRLWEEHLTNQLAWE